MHSASAEVLDRLDEIATRLEKAVLVLETRVDELEPLDTPDDE